MQVRRNGRSRSPHVRPLHSSRLHLEVLEDRLPPGDLGFTATLLDGDWIPEPFRNERRALTGSSAFALDDTAASSSQPALLSSVAALPAVYNSAVTAPTPGGTWRADSTSKAPDFVEMIGSLGFEDGPSVMDGPSMGVGPNVRANSRSTCSNPVQGRTQSEVSIVYDHTTGAMVVGYNDSRGFGAPSGCPSQDNGYQVTGWAYSLDGGFTFEDGGPLPGRTALSGDPWLTVGPDGTIYLASLYNGLSSLAVLRGTATETGIEWSNPTVISGDGAYDKEAMAVDPNTGYLYLTYTRFGGPGGIWMARSTDGGLSFDRAVPVRQGTAPQLQGSYPVVGPWGELYVAYNIGYPNNVGVGVAVSWDYGESFYDFGQLGTISNFLIPGHNRNTHTDFPQLAIDSSGGPSTGTVYLTWATQQPDTDGDVVMIRSTDYGATWSEPITVNDDGTTGLQFFPTISVDSEGNVNIAFYDRRENPDTTFTDVYFAQSRDGGESFGANLKVTEATSNWNCCSDMFPNYGDYIHSLSVGPYVAVTWADGRDGDPDAYMSWLYPLE